MDILAGLPKTKEGYQYILLVTDSFSHWAEAFPLKTQEAQEIADILYSEIAIEQKHLELVMGVKGHYELGHSF
jgi:hypothetical protein